MITKQALELCWIWDRYCHVDVSAWVQAVGSVIAIFLTVGLYGHQIYTTTKEKKKDRQQKREYQLLTARMFVNQVDNIFNQMRDAANEVNASKIVRLRYLGGQIEEVCKWSQAIQTDTFLEHELIKFVKVREVAVEIANAMKFTDNQFMLLGMEQYKSCKQRVADEIAYFQNFLN